MATLLQKILAIKNELRLKSIFPVQVGEVLQDIFTTKADLGGSTSTLKQVEDKLIHRKKTFEGLKNPADNLANEVENGDTWIYTGTPLTRYDRVQGYWLNLSGTGGGSTQPTIFAADVINFNGDRRNIINCNGDKNLIIKSK